MPGPSFAKGSIDSSSLDLETGSPGRGVRGPRAVLLCVPGRQGRYGIRNRRIIRCHRGHDSQRQCHPVSPIPQARRCFSRFRAWRALSTWPRPAIQSRRSPRKYEISADRLIEANGLLTTSLDNGKAIFLPDAKLPTALLREISGDLFKWPVSGESSPPGSPGEGILSREGIPSTTVWT